MGKKDSICKEFFRVSERFADVCNGILFAGNKVIDPEDILPSETENIYIGNTKDKKTIVDIAKCWKKNGVTLSILLLENQTNVDYGMVVRNMLTEAISYNRQILDIERMHKKNKELTSADYTCGIKKADRLTPVITIVIYLGKDAWDGARYLHEILTIDDELKAFVTNHHINLYDYHDYDSYDEFSTDVGLAFKALASRNDKNKLREIFSVNNALDGDTTRFIGTMLDIRNINKYIQKDETGKEQGSMCKAIDDIRLEGYEEGVDVGVERGIDIGVERGIDIGVKRGIDIGVERGIDIGVERGIDIGVARGEVTKTINIVIKKVDRKKTLNTIADEVEEEIEYIRPMYNAVIANPDKDADEIYNILYDDEK